MRVVLGILILVLVLLLLPGICLSADPVEVGGDFGQSWLKAFHSSPEPIDQNRDSGLWSWGGTPKGYKVVNDSLVQANDSKDDVETYEWLWIGQRREPLEINNQTLPILGYSLSPFYSDDPWVLAQHYERPIRTPKSWLKLNPPT